VAGLKLLADEKFYRDRAFLPRKFLSGRILPDRILTPHSPPVSSGQSCPDRMSKHSAMANLLLELAFRRIVEKSSLRGFLFSGKMQSFNPIRVAPGSASTVTLLRSSSIFSVKEAEYRISAGGLFSSASPYALQWGSFLHHIS